MMKTRNIVNCLGALSACLAISSAAVAQDNCSGYTIAGLGDARVVIHDDRTFAAHLATGECTATGASSAKCTYKDKDGDEWTDVSEWNTGEWLEGTWRTVSGTGKYAKAPGYGWWKMVRSDPVAIWEWGGYCALAAKKKK